jgi:hypothetical protein
MAITKSNSVLIAFDNSTFHELQTIDYLSFVQSISFNFESSSLNLKSIGQQKTITNQYVKPEITFNIEYLQHMDFFNENLFGFYLAHVPEDRASIIYNLTNNFFSKNKVLNNSTAKEDSIPFFNQNIFLFFSRNQGEDLLKTIFINGFNSSIDYVSIGSVYINSYNLSYKINELPIVSASFSGSDLSIKSIENLNNNNYIDMAASYLEDKINLNSTDNINKINSFSSRNSSALGNIVYTLKNFNFSSNFQEKTSTPGPQIDTFLSGLIQSFDVSIDLKRNKFYFFLDDLSSDNKPYKRTILLPAKGTVKISGVSEKFEYGNIEDYFNNDEKFEMTIDMSQRISDTKINASKIIINNLIVKSFNYSLDLKNIMTYTMDCEFDITDYDGIKFVRNPEYINQETYSYIASSDEGSELTLIMSSDEQEIVCNI